MPPRFSAPFGERARHARSHELKSRGLVVDAGPQARARAALRALERLSRAVVEGLEEGVIVTDARLRATTWNPSALRILGLEPEDLAGRADPFRDDLEGDSGLAERAERERTVVHGVARRPLPDGREQWLSISARPIVAESETPTGVIVNLGDITASVESERRLVDERDRAQRYLDVASTMIVVLDERGRVELVNRTGCELLGFTEEEMIGCDWHDKVLAPGDRLDARRAFMRLVSGVDQPGERHEAMVRTSSGEERRIAWRNVPLLDDRGEIIGMLSSGEDVTERRRAEAQVAYLAFHDTLTGLANRAQFERDLARDVARARRSGGSVALLYFDLDNFKLVNDSLGHAAGDEVLQTTARRVSELVRSGDVLARQGGDEFLLLMYVDGDADGAARGAAERIHVALERPFEISDAEFQVGASIGIALFPEHADDAESLLKYADAAMYQAKRARGDRIAVYHPEHVDGRARLSLTAKLSRAIENDELRLHFQPIRDLRDGTLHAVEALVRWEDPETGLVPPGAFIPVAEETGLINAIGDWVVDAVAAQGAKWAAEGLHPRLSFNLSPRQLHRIDLVDSIVAAARRHGVPPAQLCAELTESAIMSDAHRNRSVLDELHEAGLSIAIDDFGAGHSSLARLRDLPVEVLKLDRSFLARVPADPGSSAIVAAILGLARALDVDTVVEGIETEEQLRFLEEHACPYGQGYLLARPAPAEVLVA